MKKREVLYVLLAIFFVGCGSPSGFKSIVTVVTDNNNSKDTPVVINEENPNQVIIITGDTPLAIDEDSNQVDRQPIIVGNKPIFTSPSSYDVVAGERKAITLTTGEYIISDGDQVFEFAITEKSEAPQTTIDAEYGVIKYLAPYSTSATSITVTVKRVGSDAVSDPMKITFTTVYPATITTIKPVKTGAVADSDSSGLDRIFKRDDATNYNVKDPTGLIWADTNGNLNDKKDVDYQDALDYCTGLALYEAGWRVPNKDELLNLIDYSKPPYRYDSDTYTVANPPMIPQNGTLNGFENSLVNVWATKELGNYIYMSENSGTVHYIAEDDKIPIRCVKGEEISRKHLIHSDVLKYTYDETTKLEWSPSTSDAITTTDAIDYCQNLQSNHTVGGVSAPHTGFRLPSINELRTIVESGTVSDYITDGNRLLISSTPYVDENGSTDSRAYWGLILRENGTLIMGVMGYDLNNRVTCVRDMD